MKNLKKALSVATVGVMMFGLVACGNKDAANNAANAANNAANNAVEAANNAEEAANNAEKAAK